MLDEHGFTLVELLIAMVLTSVGVAATIGVFGASGRATLISQRTEVGTQQAQAEVDRLSKQLTYGELALTSTPVASTNQLNPNYRVSGSNFTVRSGLVEAFVTTPGSGDAAKVDPGPTNFSVGQGGSTITGKIYRYVTWRDENCPATICDGTQNTKRVTVAVTLDPAANAAQRAPVWFSTVVANPEAAPSGYTGTSPGTTSSSNTSAQIFYLYDERCDDEDWDDFNYTAPIADHATRNTAQKDSPSSTNSVCDNPQEPDVMGVQGPPGSDATPVYKYSSDLTGAYTGGLAMMRKGTACRASYSTAESANTAGPNKWAVHAWTTPEFEAAFHISGRVTVSAWTETVGGGSGRGLLCATLIERRVSGDVPADVILASTTFDVASWPATPRRLSFTFTVSPQVDIDPGNQLVLVLHLRQESDQDIALLYDHPSYESLLEVETTTPVGG
jgi:prepilin-type N-terminal cleavage/methylation domain-containing protein